MQTGYWQDIFTVYFTILTLAIATKAFAANESYQAGFDCAKAQTQVEKYICSNKSLAGLDLVLNEIYISKLKGGSKAEQEHLKDSQKVWLRERNACIGHLSADKYTCVLEKYRARIIVLGGIQKLIGFYQNTCASNEWDCEIAGDLELSLGRLPEAIKYYTIMCDADRDGDEGVNCYKKAMVLEKSGKIAEAEALYNKTCHARHNNDACGAAQRLGPKKASSDQWSGLYRNENGTLFIEMKNAERFSINMDTKWANGHSCGFVGNGSLINGKAQIEVNPDTRECKAEITRKGNIVAIKDPGDMCRSTWCGMRGIFEGEFVKE